MPQPSKSHDFIDIFKFTVLTAFFRKQGTKFENKDHFSQETTGP